MIATSPTASEGARTERKRSALVFTLAHPHALHREAEREPLSCVTNPQQELQYFDGARRAVEPTATRDDELAVVVSAERI